MKSFDDQIDLGAESAEDLQASSGALEARLKALRELKRESMTELPVQHLIKLELDEADLLIELERQEQAHAIARPLIEVSIQEKSWDQAVEALETVFRCHQDDALAALGQGVWLSVTFPVNPELTLTMLQHIIDETPDNSDGAAVAAATASYIVDLRAKDQQHNNLSFFTMQMLGNVARRHSDVGNQEDFDRWATRLELKDPDKFLVRLRNVVDVLVEDDWWFDRDRIRDEFPLH